jgi:hypothetical protein
MLKVASIKLLVSVMMSYVGYIVSLDNIKKSWNRKGWREFMVKVIMLWPGNAALSLCLQGDNNSRPTVALVSRYVIVVSIKPITTLSYRKPL